MSDKVQPLPNGLLVFFDGVDGVGKTTQLRLAHQALEQDGYLVEALRVNGGTPIGESLREVSLSHVPRPAATDFYIALAQHAALSEHIDKCRSSGIICLVDRSPLSIIAYQQFGDGLDPKLVQPAVVKDMRHFDPDLTLLFTSPVATAVARARHNIGGGSDYFESRNIAYFRRVTAGYTAAAAQFSCTLIDSGTPSIDEVSQVTLATIRQVIQSKLA